MRIETVDGEYAINAYMHYDKFIESRKWCHDQFGDGWGTARHGQLDRHFGGDTTFTFKRLYHAQWFLMRWDN